MKKTNEEKTLVGVIIISWFFRVAGIIIILLGLGSSILLFSILIDNTEGVFAIIISIIVGIFIVSLGVLYFLVGRGLDKLKSWARMTTIVLEILQMILSLILIILLMDISSNIISLIISGVVIYYLSKREVREAFRN